MGEGGEIQLGGLGERLFFFFLACTQHLGVCMCWHELIAKECAGKTEKQEADIRLVGTANKSQLN